MSYAIVTDSSSNLPESLIDAFGLEIFALTFIVDGEQYRSYLKGEITDLKKFYTMMREGKVIATSLPGLDEVDAIACEILDAGTDILYLGFDSAISGTFENTSSYLLRLQKDRYPERKVMCVDTRAAALGQGLFVAQAVKMRDQGVSLETLAQWASDNRLRFAHWFTVDNLSYLQRGGRLSKGAAIAGTLLNIKPVLHVDDEGRLVPVDKVRGRKKSIQALYDQFMNTAAEPKSEQSVYISQADCEEDAQALADMIRDGAGVSDILINWLDPVIGAHAGPGTLALFFQTDGQR
jgi:DegV family protein with EDD domain